MIRISPASYGRCQVQRVIDGRPVGEPFCAQFNSPKHFAEASKVLKVDRAWLVERINEWDRSAESMVEEPREEQAAFVVKVRPLFGTDGPRFAGEPLQAIREALTAAVGFPEPVIRWEGAQLAALDADWRGPPKSAEDLLRDLDRLHPRPEYAWVTHGGGLRGIYVSEGGLEAREIAAIAGLELADKGYVIELKTETRHPLYPAKGAGPRDVYQPGQLISGHPLAQLTEEAEVDPRRVEQWRQEHGYDAARYPHDRCPFCPSSQGGRDPVEIRPDGIWCYVCKRFAAFAALIGGVKFTALSTCVRKFTHWGHAKYVFEAAGYEGDWAKHAFAAALKLAHGDDPRVSAALGAEPDFAKYDHSWCYGAQPQAKVSQTLARLPAFWGPDGKPSLAAVERAEQLPDLSEMGYPSIRIIRGCRIWSHHMPPTGPTSVSVSGDHPPRYLPERDVEAAWRTLGAVLPGLRRDVITLLVAAKGISEAGGPPAIVFLSGVSKAGKSSSAQVAAAITGTRAVGVQIRSEVHKDTFYQSLYDAKSQGDYLVFDEVVKAAAKLGLKPTQALDFILDLGPRLMFKRMYVGPTALGALPVLVLTDTEVPEAVKADKQIRRRVIGAEMTSEVEWEAPLLDAGISGPGALRNDPDLAQACDAILSDIIDRFFRAPVRFEAIAQELGFGRLTDGGVVEKLLVDLYRAWELAPDAEIFPGSRSPVAMAWVALGDTDEDRQRQVTSVDWSHLVGRSVRPRVSRAAGKIKLNFA